MLEVMDDPGQKASPTTALPADDDPRAAAATAATEQAEQVASEVEDLNSADGAAVLETLSTEQAADVAEVLDPQTAANFIAEMDHALAASVISDMEPPEAATVLAYMDPDDRVDILEHVPPALHDQLVSEMDAAERAEVHELEQYPPDTAGGRMTTQVTALYEHITVDNAITTLRELSKELEQMFYVYVINRHRELVGVLSMRDLILADPQTVLSSIMIRNVRAVEASMDQEAVAQLMRKYGYLAMPVVNHNKRLLGLITLDDVIEVLEEETTEDVQKLFGAGAEERLNSPWHFSFRSRVWWLVINLATAFLAGAVVGIFEGTIQELAVLAIYMPIVAGMGGNASAQAMAVVVRGLAVGRVDAKLIRHVILRESIVGVLTGLAIALITAAVVLLWQGNPMLGVVVGLALVINHALACTTGAGIPFIMKRLGFDPAQSATIFATTVTDVGGFFAFLGLATLFRQALIGG
jgi:magnesium transporter